MALPTFHSVLVAIYPLPPLDDGLDRNADVAGEDSPGGGGRLPVDAAGGNEVGVAQLGRGERGKTRRLGALGNVILVIEIFQSQERRLFRLPSLGRSIGRSKFNPDSW